MYDEFTPDMTPAAPTAAVDETPAAESALIEAASSEYLGRWNRLISTTNWEKGRIVAEWREALIEAGAAAATYTDEAWSRRVGNVTPQHTGRLRRVYQRFALVRDSYAGLYWSHFQAALDWNDAEMWLEGAVRNRWSIAQMQAERSRVLGALVEENVEASAVEVDEDAAAVPLDQPPEPADGTMIESRDTVPPETREPDAGVASGEFAASLDGDALAVDSFGTEESPPAPPFENLPPLPVDLRDAFDGFKLAIIRQRLSGWQEVAPADVLATLEALRQLALAPIEA